MFIKKIAKRKPFVILLKLREKIYAKKERNVSELRELQIERETKHLSLSVAELFMQENATDGFNRYDTIVRLLAIECEKGINDFGWDFYRRMQTARVGDDRLEDRVIRFKNLIKSYDEGGYDTSSEIELDCNLHLKDGSHRMAMALYHHIPMINVKVRPYKHDCFYGIEFFRINGFSDAECNIIQNRYKAVLDTGINQVFVCSLWHPVRNYFEEITKYLEIFGKVVSVKDFILSEQDYKFYTKAIYYVDDIEDWKVEKKIEYMMSDRSQNYYLRMVAIELLNPKFRLKASTNGTLSQRCEFVKRLIRNAYKNKIDNYFHDIILHIGDNFYQNRFIYNLMNMPHIDVKTILSNINNYNYVIIKSETDYMPSDFPIHYPLGKGIDIICAGMNEYEKILAMVKQDVEKYRGAYNIRMVDKKDENGVVYRTLLRLELEDKLIFQFDIVKIRTGRLSEEFSIELFKGRILKNGYYVPEISKRLVLALYEIMIQSDKVLFIQYIREHLYDFDSIICGKYLDEDAKSILQRIRQDVEQRKNIDNEVLTEEKNSMLDSLLELELLLLEHNVPKDNVCIVGSAIMTIYGLRRNHDIDFIMHSDYRKAFGSELYKLNKNIDLVHENWARSKNRPTIADDELIQNDKYHTMFHGFKFATLELLCERKKWQGRPKDIKDVELIEIYLKKCIYRNNERTKNNSRNRLQSWGRIHGSFI